MKKILFDDSSGITNEVIQGNITQTISIPRIQPPYLYSKIEYPSACTLLNQTGNNPFFEAYRWRNEESEDECTDWIRPKFRTGEIVAIAQSYEMLGIKCYKYHDSKLMFFLKNGNEIPIPPRSYDNKRLVNPEHMPHQIIINMIRSCRLNELTKEDFFKQGIIKYKGVYLSSKAFKYCGEYDKPLEAYKYLINSIHGQKTWEKNPYIFVYDFELIK